MDDREPQPIYEFIPVPKLLHSEETGAPFERCLKCGRFLLSDGEQYVIEKAFRNHPASGLRTTIFEYAMCFRCMLEVHDGFSDESTARINAYFDRNVDLQARRDRLIVESGLDPDPWFSTCVVKGTPLDGETEFQVCAQCDGGDMLFTGLPFAIGGTAMEELAELLSKKTRGEIEGYMEEFFGPPGAWRDLWKDRKLVIV
jgi:hypothetical protein